MVEANTLGRIHAESENTKEWIQKIEGINIQDLELQKENLVEELSQIKRAEVEIGALLQQKYGDVNINLSTGEIIPR